MKNQKLLYGYQLIIQIIFDFLLILWILFFYIHENYKLLQLDNDIHWKQILFLHHEAILVLLISWFLIAYFIGYYKDIVNTKISLRVQSFIYQILLFSVFLFAISGYKKEDLFVNKFSYQVLFVLFVFPAFFRLLMRFIINIFIKKGVICNVIAFIPNDKAKSDIKYSFKEIQQYEIIEYINYNNLPGLSLEEVLSNQTNKIDAFIIVLEEIINQIELNAIFKLAENNLIKTMVIPNTKSFLNINQDVFYLNNLRVLTYSELPFEKFYVNFIKRTFDVIFSLFMIFFVLSWLIPIMGFLIKITSRGSVFFLQERVGFGGKPFKIVKFRTMKKNAEEYGPQLSKDKDPRTTAIGRVLRKYRIDELPQFINVLKGDMSIVGPRPEREFYVNQIIEVNPRYKRLHNLKPGITSLGQVYYGYAENVKEMSERLNYDLLYLNNYNFFMDLKIITLTIGVMIKGKGK